QTANMLKNHHLAKSISDVGWSAFLSILAAKAAYAGRRVVAVPPAYTSQNCSGCGRIVSKGLSVRWHQCPYEDCGASLHRDHNAARNIERLGQSLRGGAGVLASENRESPAFMRGSVKNPLAGCRNYTPCGTSYDGGACACYVLTRPIKEREGRIE